MFETFCFLILFLQITKEDQSSDIGLFPCKFGTFNKVIDMYTCWLKTDIKPVPKPVLPRSQTSR